MTLVKANSVLMPEQYSLETIEVPSGMDDQSTSMSPDADDRFVVMETIEDLRQHVIKARGNYDNIVKRDTIYFHLVQGGNARLVTLVLEYMREKRLKDEMTWALGTDWEPSVHPKAATFRLYKQLWCACRVMLFIILWLLFAALTPVFYVLHAICCQIITKVAGRIAANPDLPLLLAILSENADMVRLFLQYGASPRCTDRHGNTVYHYLADISAEDPDKFKRCHQLLKETVDESKHSLLTDILANKENDMGLSPLEFLVQRGSIAVFIHLTREECCLGRLKVAVSFDHATIKTLHEGDEGSGTSTNLLAEFSSREAFFVGQNGSDTALDGHNPLLLSQKFNLIRREFDVTKYEKRDIYGKQSLLLQLLTSRCVQSMGYDDVTTLVNSLFLNTWINLNKRAVWLCLVLKYALYLAITVCLLWGIVITKGLAANRKPLLPHLFREIVAVTATMLVERTDTLPFPAPNGGTIHVQCFKKYSPVKGTTIDGCEYAAILKLNESCHLDIAELIQNTLTDDSDSDLDATAGQVSQVIMWFAVMHLMIDFAQRTLFLGRKVFNSTSSKAAVINTLTTRLCGSYTDKVLKIFMCCMLVFYNRWASAIIIAYADTKRSAMNEAVMHLTNGDITPQDLHAIVRQYAVDFTQLLEWDSILLCTCLLICIFLVIHSLRLVPKIGFFILTSRKMGGHLLEFGVVYGVITVIFAAIFNFIMTDDICPAKKIDGFESFTYSLFTVYTLSLGGEAANAFLNTHGTNARIAFAVYTLISVILLLNLIIAVMTTTADQLSRSPWREALCKMEVWDEILGIEATFLTLVTPILWLISCIKRKSSRRQGHQQQTRSSEGKVLIPVTYYVK